MKQVTVCENVYNVGRLSTFQQMNLAADFRDGLQGLASLRQGRPENISDEKYAKTVQFIVTGGLSVISPDRRLRVMSLCLSCVQRKMVGPQGGGAGWGPMINQEGGLQYADVGPAQLVVLMYEMFEVNGLLDFFSEGPLDSEGPEKNQESGRDFQMGKTG